MKTINAKKEKETSINEAIEILNKGGLVIFPTETCYGVAADASNPKAVDKLLSFKGQRGNKPISVAVDDINMARKYVDINSVAESLYKNFLPGPLTVVSKSKGKVDKRLEAETDTLGVRIPDHNFALSLVRKFKKPITATSANSSGRKPPYSLKDFRKYNTKKTLSLTDLFLDYGSLEERLPSTIVDTTLQDPKILRKGELKIKGGNEKVTRSDEETIEYAKDLTQKLGVGVGKIIALQGDLGAGKTHFTKGIAKALGVKEEITSPTYTIVKEYETSQGHMYHIDTWRLSNEETLKDLGLEEMVEKGVVVIEWIQKVKEEVDNLSTHHPVIWIDIKETGKNSRVISHQVSS